MGGSVAGALLTADLFLGNWGHYRKVDREAFLNSSPNIHRVKSDPSQPRVYTDPVLLRALVRPEGKEIPLENFLQERFYLDYPIIHRVFNAFGFPVLVFKPYKDLIVLLETSPQPQATDILRLLNVKYLLWVGSARRSGVFLDQKTGALPDRLGQGKPGRRWPGSPPGR